ncbi:ABC transporter ATP-binding protein [Amorphus sp. 3PC139-8]|uniref:ABC transporter ATP-binding protein n=1 Tax=Amorphus sp. 3PC139-8 TaxID=2735676 RepID=UPI00345C81DB
MTSPLLEIRDCDAFYGDSHILHSISLEITAGSGVALLGRNGAGKSTLLKSIMAAGPTVRGDIRLNGDAIMRLPAHRRAAAGLSLVPEDRRIFPHISVAENLLMGRRATRNGDTPLTLSQVTELFPMLADLLDRRGDQLSGGQQQILAVARGLVSKPQLLLLDEPAEGLAPIIVQDLAEQIAGIRERAGTSLLLAEQNVSFARHCTEQVFVIDTGRIVFSGGWEAFDADAERIERFLAV